MSCSITSIAHNQYTDMHTYKHPNLTFNPFFILHSSFFILHFPGRPKLPDLLAQTMSWVLGEYGYLSQDPNIGPDSIVTALCELVANSEDSATRGCAVTAGKSYVYV